MKLISLIMHRPASMPPHFFSVRQGLHDNFCPSCSSSSALSWHSLDSFLNILIDCHSCLMRWVQRFANLQKCALTMCTCFWKLRKQNSQWVHWKGYCSKWNIPECCLNVRSVLMLLQAGERSLLHQLKCNVYIFCLEIFLLLLFFC